MKVVDFVAAKIILISLLLHFQIDAQTKFTRVGNQIFLGKNSVILKGVSIADPYTLKEEGKLNQEFFFEIAKTKANTVRIPFHPGHFIKYKEKYINDYMQPALSFAKKENLFIILDYHGIGNPISNWSESKLHDSSLVAARNFWKIVSQKYKEENFIYELFNEPAHINWEEWNKLIPILYNEIRKYDAKAFVLIGGIDWAYDLSNAHELKLNNQNYGFTSHPYPQKPKPWDTYFGKISETFPVILTEWGYEENGNIPTNGTKDYALELFSYCKKKKIGWIAWIYHPNWKPNMLKQDYLTPNEFGKIVIKEMKIILEE